MCATMVHKTTAPSTHTHTQPSQGDGSEGEIAYYDLTAHVISSDSGLRPTPKLFSDILQRVPQLSSLPGVILARFRGHVCSVCWLIQGGGKSTDDSHTPPVISPTPATAPQLAFPLVLRSPVPHLTGAHLRARLSEGGSLVLGLC